MVKGIIAIVCFISFGALRAQPFDQNAYSGIGVQPYKQPPEPRYRLLFGYGADGGLGGLTPRTYIGSISREFAPSVLTAGFLSSSSNSRGFPRRTYSEFDLLYGIAYDGALQHYAGASELFHASISAGICLSAYQTNSRFRKPVFPDSNFNTTQISPGLPIQLQAIYEPIRYLGIGALLFYTISAFQPSYGGAVVVEVRY